VVTICKRTVQHFLARKHGHNKEPITVFLILSVCFRKDQGQGENLPLDLDGENLRKLYISFSFNRIPPNILPLEPPVRVTDPDPGSPVLVFCFETSECNFLFRNIQHHF
jgi:hypothetical protein